MACRYFLGDKELTGEALISYMKALPHTEKLKIAPEIAKDSYSNISWTPGEAQAARYDLSKQVDRLYFNKNKDGTFNLSAEMQNRKQELGKNISQDKLADHIGKEPADKIIKKFENYKGKETSGSLDKPNLKVGGQGMKAFYDKMLVDKMRALTKKHGGKVEQKSIGTSEGKIVPRAIGGFRIEGDNANLGVFDTKEAAEKALTKSKQPVHVLKITPELREHVLKKGFPLFASAPIFTSVDYNPFEKDK